MISKEDLEDLEKKKMQSKIMDNVIDFMLEMLPNNDFNDLIRKQHTFNKIDKEVLEKATNKELTKEQVQQLTSVYEQMKNILEDILNKK